jgi:hypothetical protein
MQPVASTYGRSRTMMLPPAALPTAWRLFVDPPPSALPCHDVAPVVVAAPRWRRLRRPAAASEPATRWRTRPQPRC